MLQKNQTVTATIDGYSSEGLGIARVEGQVVFVHDAVAGEVCDILILKVLKNAAFGKVAAVRQPSPHRTAPDCPHYRRCGGCAFRHMDYEAELSAKYQRVQDALTRLGGWQGRVEEILPAPAVAGYRNKSLHPVDEQGSVGFFRARSHQVEPIDDCLLQQPTANAAARALADWIKTYHIPCYREDSHTGLVRHLFTRTNGKGECLVCVIANGDSARVVRVRRVHELYGFRFAEVWLRFTDYDDMELQATVLLDTLTAEAPALTREQNEQLFDGVMADYEDVPLKADRLKQMRADNHFNALQVKYAYAVTCHKAQGGQWQHVYVDQGYMTDDMLTPDYLHWLYTAFTRATDKLYLVNWPKTQTELTL